MKRLPDKILKVTIASCAGILCACAGAQDDELEKVGDAQEMFGCRVLNVYNAGEYIDEEVVPNF
ncbi:MAG: ABC transporter substrate-binding protein, partial [Solobacterium sp.]|nr:ABC transporter substrate-binding protein [Solobacterium sp.]